MQTHPAKYTEISKLAPPWDSSESIVLNSGEAVEHTAAGRASGFLNLEDFNAYINQAFSALNTAFVVRTFGTDAELKSIVDEIRDEQALGLFVYFIPGAHHCVVLEPTSDGFSLSDVNRAGGALHQIPVLEQGYSTITNSIRSNSGSPVTFFGGQPSNVIGEIAMIRP